MVESGSPMLQQKGLDMLSSMQSSMMSGAGRSPTTFAIGAEEGKMQRASLDAKGKAVLQAGRSGALPAVEMEKLRSLGYVEAPSLRVCYPFKPEPGPGEADERDDENEDW